MDLKKIVIKSKNGRLFEKLLLTENEEKFQLEIKDNFWDLLLGLLSQKPDIIIVDVSDSDSDSDKYLRSFENQLKRFSPLIIVGHKDSIVKIELSPSVAFVP